MEGFRPSLQAQSQSTVYLRFLLLFYALQQPQLGARRLLKMKKVVGTAMSQKPGKTPGFLRELKRIVAIGTSQKHSKHAYSTLHALVSSAKSQTTLNKCAQSSAHTGCPTTLKLRGIHPSFYILAQHGSTKSLLRASATRKYQQ